MCKRRLRPREARDPTDARKSRRNKLTSGKDDTQMNHVKTLVAGVALIAGLSTAAQAASTLEGVKAAGKVKCGVTTGLAGFGAPNDQGVWAGLDIDLCKAVAAAVLGDPSKVEYK